ncbi:MAG: amidohydrolase family protein [Cyanobacteria bacterium TGS_CYA1]|nr:amidohydrolase family protein [Cyanobacteria bacterium TGS_CYA1]
MCALEDQFIKIEEGLIKHISPELPSNVSAGEICDYGESIAMPGLINLHCHLDYSKLSHTDLPQKTAKDSGSILFSWIPQLIAKTASWSQDEYMDSALQGAKLAALSGTSFLVDNSFQAVTGLNALASLGLKGILGLELFGVDPIQAESQFGMWKDRFEKVRLSVPDKNKNIELTVSPHAPYTVSPQLWRLAADFASRQNTKVLAHICESQLEFDWFNNTKPDPDKRIDRFLLDAFTRFRKQAGLEEQVAKMIEGLSWRGCGHSPLEHLKRNGLLDANLLATHCVTVNDQDIESMRLASTSVAVCPISNFLLANGTAPIEKFVSSKLKLGLGTDSLASSYSLDLRETARFVIENSKLDSKKVLLLLTFEAAKALSKEKEIGSIEKDKRADILILKLSSRNDTNKNVFDLALMPETLVEDLFVDGRKVVSKGNLVQTGAF